MGGFNCPVAVVILIITTSLNAALATECGVGIENVDVVDLETAKYIKNLGFDRPTQWYWQDKTLTFVEKGLKRVKMGKRRMNHNKYDEWIYSAPTRDELMRWVNSL